jgi:DUF1009 family protein
VQPLGIIAGGGELPAAIAESAEEAGRAVFIVALRGSADERVTPFPHEWSGIGEVGRTMSLLRNHACSEIVLAGQVLRPQFSELKLDTKGMMLLPGVVAAARKGDDALLRRLAKSFEADGFRIVGVAEAAPGLLAPEGVFGRRAMPDACRDDIAQALDVVRRLGELDVGQAAVVCEGLVLAVEAAEGTDAMLARVATLPRAIRGKPGRPRGVLVKALKPVQDGKTDLPVIGLKTVEGAKAAGLAGIAVEAGQTLVLGRRAVEEAADSAGQFLFGFPSPAFRT